MEMSSNCPFPAVHWICSGSRSRVELKNLTSFSPYQSGEELAQRQSILPVAPDTERPARKANITSPHFALPTRAAATFMFLFGGHHGLVSMWGL